MANATVNGDTAGVAALSALLDNYRVYRKSGETFIDCVRRLGPETFKLAANAVRHETRDGGRVLHVHLATADAATV